MAEWFKAIDLKSVGLCPRRFESYSCSVLVHFHTRQKGSGVHDRSQQSGSQYKTKDAQLADPWMKTRWPSG